MTKKLQHKFILLSIGSVSLVLFLIAGLITLSNYSQIRIHAKELLQLLSENDGYFPKSEKHKNSYDLPPKFSPEAPFSTRFFSVKTDKTGNILSIDTGKIASVSTDQAADFAKKALQKGKSQGSLSQYQFQIDEKEYGSLIIFVDCSRDLELFYSYLKSTVSISAAGITLVFLLVLIFSNKAIAPVAESYAKQKQFITDASHELKTPLAIISANTEVLELEYGSSEWTKSIRSQTNRLSRLIHNMIFLTRMDEGKTTLCKTDFSITDAVTETAEPFFPVAKAAGKEIRLQLEPSLTYFGHEESIRQLLTILLDNSIKYSSDSAIIDFTLKKQGKKILLQSSNPTDHLKIGSYACLFERFYRLDASRNSKNGGYGIGLSVAKTIAENHKGRVKAQSPDGKKLVITVYLF